MIELWTVDARPAPSPDVSYNASGGQGKNTTNDEGVFDMPNVAPGKHRVIVYRPSPIGGDRSMQQVPVQGRFLKVESGERFEDFEILVNPPEDFTISGHVRDAAGNPVPGIGVDTFIPHGRHWWTKTDENGAYYIEGLDGIGTSSFKLNFNNVSGARSFKLAIPDVPLNAEGVDFIVPRNGSIQGTVRNAKTGELVTTYEVVVPVLHLPDSGVIWEEPDVHIARGPDGTFALSEVPAGEAIVEIRAGGLGVQRFTVPVEANETTPLDCEMSGPAIFAGRTIMNGEPKKTTIVINGEWLGSDDAGNFSFDEYPNGNLLAWFFLGDGWHRSVEVELKSGETTRLDVEVGGSCEVLGTVTFPDDEEDFCTIRLAAKPAPDGWQVARSRQPAVPQFAIGHPEYVIQQPGGWTNETALDYAYDEVHDQ